MYREGKRRGFSWGMREKKLLENVIQKSKMCVHSLKKRKKIHEMGKDVRKCNKENDKK